MTASQYTKEHFWLPGDDGVAVACPSRARARKCALWMLRRQHNAPLLRPGQLRRIQQGPQVSQHDKRDASDVTADAPLPLLSRPVRSYSDNGVVRLTGDHRMFDNKKYGNSPQDDPWARNVIVQAGISFALAVLTLILFVVCGLCCACCKACSCCCGCNKDKEPPSQRRRLFVWGVLFALSV
jgi:hypothetical protein